MKEEIWKDMPGYEGLYQASNLGRIKSLDKVVFQKAKNNSTSKHIYKGKILKPILHDTGYNYVTLNCKNISVHRLVAKTFIPNMENKPFVNHIDGNKLNNNANNLEWCTAKENMQHAFENNLINNKTKLKKESELKNIKKATLSNYKKVNMYDKGNLYIKTFNSIIEASIETKSNAGHIVQCCKHKQKTCGGYKWEYANE